MSLLLIISKGKKVRFIKKVQKSRNEYDTNQNNDTSKKWEKNSLFALNYCLNVRVDKRIVKKL